MRVTRRTTARLWRAWWAALALTLGYAAVALGTAPAISAGRPPLVIREVPPSTTPTRPTATDTTTTFITAAPFSLGPASALDRTRALRCLADAVYYEAAGEPEAGQRAVAQVVLNRVRHAAYPATVCGVVYQGAPGPGCQFSFACDGALARVPAAAAWGRAARIAAAALAGRVEPSVGLATYYHSYAVTPAWNRELVMTAAIGRHLFHRWAGAQGTPAAFGRRYAGGEPALPLASPVTDASAVVAAEPAPVPVATAPIASPAAPIEEDHLPAAATVLPRWQESGKPL